MKQYLTDSIKLSITIQNKTVEKKVSKSKMCFFSPEKTLKLGKVGLFSVHKTGN
jgi:hypothetical protein